MDSGFRRNDGGREQKGKKRMLRKTVFAIAAWAVLAVLLVVLHDTGIAKPGASRFATYLAFALITGNFAGAAFLCFRPPQVPGGVAAGVKLGFAFFAVGALIIAAMLGIPGGDSETNSDFAVNSAILCFWSLGVATVVGAIMRKPSQKGEGSDWQIKTDGLVGFLIKFGFGCAAIVLSIISAAALSAAREALGLPEEQGFGTALFVRTFPYPFMAFLFFRTTDDPAGIPAGFRLGFIFALMETLLLVAADSGLILAPAFAVFVSTAIVGAIMRKNPQRLF